MSRLISKRLQVAAIACATLAAATSAAHAQNALLLSVDPYSGGVTVQNPYSSTSSLSLDGYQITSAAGALVPDPTHTGGVGWDSLTDAGVPGWQTFAPTTATGLSELNLTTATAIAPGASLNLGHAFTPGGAQDLQWAYTIHTPGVESLTNPGSLTYAGGLQVQVIRVVNPDHSVITTQMVLLNQESSGSFQFDGYTIRSASGSLNPAGFTGFSGSSSPGTWQSIAPSANLLSELNLTGSATLAPGHDQVLGQSFTTNATKDVALQFHLVGSSFNALNGTLLYKDQMLGDANGDGFVNGLDISVIAGNWLSTGTLAGDLNYDGVVNGLDIGLIAGNWLHTLSGGGGSGTGMASVPEPSTSLLVLIGIISGCGLVRRRGAPRL